MLEAKYAEGKMVCVGLDSEWEKIPAHLKPVPDLGGNWCARVVGRFNFEIIKVSRDLACAYKLNLAPFVKRGREGIDALADTITHIKALASDVPVILDTKYADIGNTNNGYAEFAFEYLGADAITVNSYLGAEALEPFLKRADKGVIVLCRTSNPGAGEFQDLEVRRRDFLSDLHPESESWEPMYLHVARQVARTWNKQDNCALVVGATYPDELRKVREIVGDMPILVPGVGAQGGDVEKVVKAGVDSRGLGLIVNSSRGIIFASSGEDFAEAARRETDKLHNLISQYRKAV